MKWVILAFIELFFCWHGFYYLGVSLSKLLAAWSAMIALVFPFYVLTWLLFDSLFKSSKKEALDELQKESAEQARLASYERRKLTSCIDDLNANLLSKTNGILQLEEEIGGLKIALQNQKQISNRFKTKLGRTKS